MTTKTIAKKTKTVAKKPSAKATKALAAKPTAKESKPAGKIELEDSRRKLFHAAIECSRPHSKRGFGPG